MSLAKKCLLFLNLKDAKGSVGCGLVECWLENCSVKYWNCFLLEFAKFCEGCFGSKIKFLNNLLGRFVKL